MNQTIVKNGKLLRRGFTTGACAAAAAKAAALLLLTGQAPDSITITLPGEEACTLPLHEKLLALTSARCAVKKDAGDDPDVTHGLLICATVEKKASGISILGGAGVGTVTKPGLACPPGSPAINPGPQKMILQALREISAQCGYEGGFLIAITVPGGEETAQKTYNPRLGIVGGISILGTTGIVEPMSESALIETIKLELSARQHDEVLLLSPGNYGRDFARTSLGLNVDHAVKCSNFLGEALDHAAYLKIPKILLVGHSGKLIKLAAGVMNTHSHTADCRGEIYAAHAALCGCTQQTACDLMEAPTTDEMHRILSNANLAVPAYQSILTKILFHLNHRLPETTEIGVIIFTNAYGILMESGNAGALLKEYHAKSNLKVNISQT